MTGALAGRKALIVGIANEHSIAWGCAKALHDAGATLAVTYLNAKAEPHVRGLAARLDVPLILPLDVTDDAALAALFETLRRDWGRLDCLIHSIAYAPREDLKGRVVDSTREGFLTAMDISVHSLIRLARAAEPLMNTGGTIMTVSYYGAEKVVDPYNLMGPVKAALEATARELTVELGPRGIRVYVLSPGPIPTRAASGIPGFEALLDDAAARAPLGGPVSIDQVGALAAFLASDAAAGLTGNVVHVDGGLHVRA